MNKHKRNLFRVFFSALSFIIADFVIRISSGTYLNTEVEGLRIKSWEEPRAETFIDWNFFIDVFYILTGLLFIFAIVFTYWRNGFIYSFSPYVKNLFFPISYRIKCDNPPSHKGYLRHLNNKKALLMCQENLHQGTILNLDLGNLPGFPNKNFKAGAYVTSSRKLSKSYYYVWVRFKNLDILSKSDLTKYLEYLKPKKTMIYMPAN